PARGGLPRPQRGGEGAGRGGNPQPHPGPVQWTGGDHRYATAHLVGGRLARVGGPPAPAPPDPPPLAAIWTRSNGSPPGCTVGSRLRWRGPGERTPGEVGRAARLRARRSAGPRDGTAAGGALSSK